MSKPAIQIGNQIIEETSPPYIIAEAGVHHYNSLTLAKEYMIQAKLCGVDAIKFQTYSANRIATTWAPTYWNDKSGKTQFDIFAERSNLAYEDYRDLFNFAKELKLTLLSTPFDPDSAALLAEFDMAAFKIASADLTYYPLLETIASYKKPILLSTGAATFAEVEEAITFLKSLNAQFCLLHCVLSYPTPIKDANLQRIVQLKKRFPEMIVGYSDHTQPQYTMIACPIAVSNGAQIIEKHFTLNNLLDEDDHYHAVDVSGLKRLVRDCKDAKIMAAAAEEMKESEIPARTYARRSIVAAKSLKAGTIITKNDIDFKRPGTGLSPVGFAQVLGKELMQDIAQDDLIKLEHLC